MKPLQRLTLIVSLVLILCALGLALLMTRQHAESLAALHATQVELRLMRTAQLQPEQVREAVMHGSVDADKERQRRKWEHEAEMEKFREQQGAVSSPASIDSAVQRAMRVARGER